MNNEPQPFCSIIIPALNEEEHIGSCLEALTQQTYPKELYEVILVDNGSTDKTIEIAKKYAIRIEQKLDGNVGAVRNHGIYLSRGQIVVCTDADCVVGRNWLEIGVNKLITNKDLIMGGGLKPRENASWIERYWLLNDAGEALQQRDLMGSCIFLWKDTFLTLGGFSERITSGEDSDLSIRARAAGLSVEFSANLSVAHLGNPDTVSSFIKRQTWHSENYIIEIKNSIKDKIFWLTALYASCLILLPFLIHQGQLLLALSLTQITPAILSTKRIMRSRYKAINPKGIALILTIDNLYLIGRTLGIIKGIKNFRNAKQQP